MRSNQQTPRGRNPSTRTTLRGTKRAPAGVISQQPAVVVGNRFAAHEATSRPEAIALGPYTAGLYAIDNNFPNLLRHAVFTMGADPNRLVTTDPLGSIERTLLGIAFEYGNKGAVRWLLKHGGASPNAYAFWEYDEEMQQQGKHTNAYAFWEYDEEMQQQGKHTHRTPLQVTLEAAADPETGFCPQPILLALLRHGATTTGLVEQMQEDYHCAAHGNVCAGKVLGRLLSSQGAQTEGEGARGTLGSAAVAFALTKTSRPLRVLSALLPALPPPARVAEHPLAVCATVIRELGDDTGRLVNPFLWLLAHTLDNSRLQEVVSIEEVVGKVLWELARWDVAGDPEMEDVRRRMLAVLLDMTRVHPDTVFGSRPQPLLMEMWNLLRYAQEKEMVGGLGFVEELLRRGADVVKPWRDGQGTEYTPLLVATQERDLEEVLELFVGSD